MKLRILHSLRRVLGRIASAASVAALPWAGVLVAATSGAMLWVALGSIATLAILLWGFAPHLPYLRALVPGGRRIGQLDEFWKEGKLITRGVIEDEDDLSKWIAWHKEWSGRVSEWIEDHISTVEAERFRRPKLVAYDIVGSFDSRHSDRLLLIHAQLSELIRLRGEQEAKLK